MYTYDVYTFSSYFTYMYTTLPHTKSEVNQNESYQSDFTSTRNLHVSQPLKTPTPTPQTIHQNDET